MADAAAPAVKGVIFDAAGTLTVPLVELFLARLEGAPFDPREAGLVLYRAVQEEGDDDSLPHRCERGEVPLDELIDWAEAQAPGAGRLIDPDSPHHLLAEIVWSPPMLELLAQVGGAGLATAVLSNQFAGWESTFGAAVSELGADAVVISCLVGMRKPDPAIYHHTCGLIGTDPGETLFLDDSAAMVAGAEAAGLRALHVADHEATVAEVRRLLDLPTP